MATLNAFEHQRHDYFACFKCTLDCFSTHGRHTPSPHADPRIVAPPSFVKLVSSLMLDQSCLDRCCLEIPHAFADAFLRTCVGEAKLQGPSGWVWYASFQLGQSSVCLTGPGWGEFAKDHDLQDGDMVVFTYLGKNLFKVRVYEVEGGAEKGKNCVPSKSRLNCASTCAGDKRKAPENGFNSVCKARQERDLEGEEMSQKSNSQGDHHHQKAHISTQKKASSLPNCEKEVILGSPRPAVNVPPSHNDRYSTKRKANSHCTRTRVHEDNKHEKKAFPHPYSNISNSEKTRVINLANAFQSKHPITRKKMTPSSLYSDHKLFIFRPFANKYLPKRDAIITLIDPMGESWSCKWMGSHFQRKRGAPFLSGGWGPFAKTQRLKEHDICIFELTDTKKLHFNVHILRTRAETLPSNKLQDCHPHSVSSKQGLPTTSSVQSEG